MRATAILSVPLLALLSLAAPGAVAASDEVLLLRQAVLLGARDPGRVPISGEARSPEELARYLTDWSPGEETEEIRELFALEEVGEIFRQAFVLPLGGGRSSSVYTYNGHALDLRFDVGIEPEEVVDARIEIRSGGSLVSAPRIQTRLGERAIVSSTDPAGGLFLFLVLEVDRVTRASIEARGLRYAGRDDVLTVEGDVQPPRVLHKVPPRYTDEARADRVQGVVILRLLIDETGAVTDVEPLKELPLGLAGAAIEAVRQWKFEPARLDGEPVSVLYNITINFRLTKDGAPPDAASGPGGPA